MGPHNGRLFGYLSLALCIGVVGCSNPQPPPQDVPKVTVAPPEKRELTNYVEFNGWLEPAESVDVRARVRGHIHKVNFTDGQMVKKGELLFELDPRPFQASLDAAKGQLDVAEANLDLANKEYARTYKLSQTGAAS